MKFNVNLLSMRCKTMRCEECYTCTIYAHKQHTLEHNQQHFGNRATAMATAVAHSRLYADNAIGISLTASACSNSAQYTKQISLTLYVYKILCLYVQKIYKTIFRRKTNEANKGEKENKRANKRERESHHVLML